MSEAIAVIVLLWLIGVIRIPWLGFPHLEIFSFGGVNITLERLLTLILVLWLASTAPSPLRQMFWVFVILWLLSIAGIVMVGSMTNLVLIAIITGLVLSIVQKK